MSGRQLIGGAAYPPDVLKVILQAFDDAWDEVTGDVSARASAIKAARLSLASIVLTLARLGSIEREALKTAAVVAFRSKHRIRQ